MLTGSCGVACSGFFENAEADAKARGEAPAKKKSKEEQFSDFMSGIAADVREVEAREEAEAAAAAAERAERDAFEQRCAASQMISLACVHGVFALHVCVSRCSASACKDGVMCMQQRIPLSSSDLQH